MPKSSTSSHVNATRLTPLIAREEELERILALLTTVALGRGQVVLLEGEAGVGKTRLAREVLARARAAGVHTFLGRCFDQYTAVPFFPFAELFAAMLADTPPELRTESHTRWPELAYIVLDPGTPRNVSSQETQLQVFRAAAGFVRALAKASPLVLWLDDLHWADSTSLALLLYLGRHLQDAPVLILGTYRAADGAGQQALELTLRELIRERLADEVDLEPLQVEGTAALIQSRLLESSVSQQLIALVHERAQGNPFFTEELLAAFVDKGVVTPGAADLQTAALAEFRLPRSIHSVVRERVGRLPPAAQETLILASILGQEFDLDILVAASGCTEAAIVAALEAGVAARLLDERQADRGERYGFLHALIQEALYEQLPAHRRRELHLRMGEVLEELRAQPATAAAELTRHFLQAGDAGRAQAYAIQAGDQAASRYAHAEAAQHYALALKLLRERGDEGMAARAHLQLAGELQDLNRLLDAEAAYEAALAAFEQLGDRGGQASAHWGLGRLHDSRYDMLAAVRHLSEALRLWPSEDEHAGLASLLADAARAKSIGGDSAGAIQLAQRGFALAERLGDAGLLARALLGLVTAHHQDMLDRPMVELLDRAEGLARTAGDWRTLSRIYSSRAVNRFHIGALDESLADCRRSIEAAERSAETQRLAFAYQSQASDCIAVGAWDEGRAAARAGLALDPQIQVSAHSGSADLAWMEGRHDEAVSERRLLLSDARARGDMQGVTDGLATLADLALQLGRPSEAEPPAREAVEVARSSWRSEMGECLAVLSETLAWLDAPDVEAVLRDAERLMDELGRDASRPQLLRAKGRLLARRGDFAGATLVLEQSAAVARSQHSLIHLGRTLAVLGDAARHIGDRELASRSDVERAAIAERIGPEVRGLAWAQGLRGARSAPRGRVRSIDSEQAAPLSPREQQVAALIAQGLTDHQIADRLTITEGTAGVHVGHILNKLGFHARTQIASWVVRHGLCSTPEPLN